MWPDASTRHRFDQLWTAEICCVYHKLQITPTIAALHIQALCLSSCTYDLSAIALRGYVQHAQLVSGNSVSVPWCMQKPGTMGVIFELCQCMHDS